MSPARKDDPIELSYSDTLVASPLMQKFIYDFSPADAAHVITCGLHRRDRQRLTDPFEDALFVAVAYDCFTVYRESHGFTATTEELKAWVNANCNFEKYQKQGDMSDIFHKKYKAFSA